MSISSTIIERDSEIFFINVFGWAMMMTFSCKERLPKTKIGESKNAFLFMEAHWKKNAIAKIKI